MNRYPRSSGGLALLISSAAVGCGVSSRPAQPAPTPPIVASTATFPAPSPSSEPSATTPPPTNPCSGPAPFATTPAPGLELAKNGDQLWWPLGRSVVASPAARAMGFRVQLSNDEVACFPEGVLGIRRGNLLVVTVSKEAEAAWSYLASDGPKRMSGIHFHISDAGLLDATANEAAAVGESAGVRLVLTGEPWMIACFNCTAPDIIAGLIALGGKRR